MRTATRDRLRLMYPETDGEPMAENTLQFEWIVLIKLGLEACFADRHDVFVAGDLFWYPVEGRPDIRLAPDVLVAIDRPKGHRGSYLQWLEDNIPPQVVFEILSPGNRAAEMQRKFAFYEKYGVEEYYIYDPGGNDLEGYQRQGDKLTGIPGMRQWISPLLGIRFEWTKETLYFYQPDGERFLTYLELVDIHKDAVQKLNQQREQLYAEMKKTHQAQRLARAAQKKAKAAQEEVKAAREKIKTAQTEAKAAQEEAKAARDREQRLAERLRQLGINPDAVD